MNKLVIAFIVIFMSSGAYALHPGRYSGYVLLGGYHGNAGCFAQKNQKDAGGYEAAYSAATVGGTTLS